MSSRCCFALDLVDDDRLIAEYCKMHEPGSVWPQVIEHIRRQGVETMQIWRRNDRLFMIMETASDYPRPIGSMELQRANVGWETLMANFQRRLTGTQPEEKWAAMECIFELIDHVGVPK